MERWRELHVPSINVQQSDSSAYVSEYDLFSHIKIKILSITNQINTTFN